MAVRPLFWVSLRFLWSNSGSLPPLIQLYRLEFLDCLHCFSPSHSAQVGEHEHRKYPLLLFV